MTKDHRQPTCEQRIDAHLESRLEEFLPDVESWSIRKCAKRLRAESRDVERRNVEDLRSEVRELVRDQASESVLSIERITTYRLCLSWGGPSDYFELHWHEDSGAWHNGHYLFQDWFDGARRTLSPEQTESLAELFGIYPDAE